MYLLYARNLNMNRMRMGPSVYGAASRIRMRRSIEGVPRMQYNGRDTEDGNTSTDSNCRQSSQRQSPVAVNAISRCRVDRRGHRAVHVSRQQPRSTNAG